MQTHATKIVHFSGAVLLSRLTRPTLVALTLIGLATAPRVWSGEAKPSPGAKGKPSRAQLEAQFKKVEAERIGTKEQTKERADLARKAMQIASDVAWQAFDAGQLEEAVNWFQKGVELKQESYVNARSYWEKFLQTAAVEQDGAVEGQVKELETQLAAADESKKDHLRTVIRRWDKNRYLTRSSTLATLQQMARDNNDAENLLKYSEQMLEIRRQELNYLKKVTGSNEEVNQKSAQIATALEQVSNAQADLALFEQAEKGALEAVALRRALPERMPERKLEESLSALARMYALGKGDLSKARDYNRQTLTDVEASAAVRQPELKEPNAQTRDLILVLDRMAQAEALLDLGDLSQKNRDFKKAASYYEMARKVGEDLPKGGHLNLFELFRARIQVRVLSSLASLKTGDGKTSPPGK